MNTQFYAKSFFSSDAIDVVNKLQITITLKGQYWVGEYF